MAEDLLTEEEPTLDTPVDASEGGGFDVCLHVYDLSKGWIKRSGSALFGRPIGGIYHTGVVVYGREYFFEGGLTSVAPGRTRFGKTGDKHVEKRRMGKTNVTQEEFELWVRSQERLKYGPLEYHLVENNCNHFSEDAVRFLLHKEIDQDIASLPDLMTTTAVGRLTKSLVDKFFGGWQWTSLINQWRARKRLSRQWDDWEVNAVDRREKEASAGPDFLSVKSCPAPPDAQWRQRSLFDGLDPDKAERAAKRRIAVSGMPPPRIFAFQPATDNPIWERLSAAVPESVMNKDGTKKGLQAVCDRLRAIAAEADLHGGAAERAKVKAARWTLLPAAEALVLVRLISPGVSSMLMLCHKVHQEGVDTKGETIKKMRRRVEEELPTLLVALEALSVLTLRPETARVLLHPYRRMLGVTRGDLEKDPERDPRARLRNLLLSDAGFMGIAAEDYKDMPPTVQALFLRVFCNIFAAGSGLGRLMAIGMAQMRESDGILYNVGWVARKATLGTMKCMILRLTAASLLCNAVCEINAVHEESQAPRNAFPPRRETGSVAPPLLTLPRALTGSPTPARDPKVGDRVRFKREVQQRLLAVGWDFMSQQEMLFLSESSVVTAIRTSNEGTKIAVLRATQPEGPVEAAYDLADLEVDPDPTPPMPAEGCASDDTQEAGEEEAVAPTSGAPYGGEEEG
eukprot:Hpha_TRINITY_DN19388_c0_g1::TRINITY_DN19388_c0_g1_i1::g.81202::m.81202